MKPTFRHLFRKVFTYLLRGVAAVCFLILSFLAAGELGGRITVNTDFQETPGGIEIFIVSNGIHTDIVVPAVTDMKDWTATFDPANFEPPLNLEQVDRIAFGWGDIGLYENVPTWADLTFGIAARSLLLPTQSAMHVTYYRSPPHQTDMVRRIEISQEQYRTLVHFVEQSFIYTGDRLPVSLDCCWYPGIHDNFYRSIKNYHLLRTCNNWTNNALKQSGIRTALWTPFHDRILHQLDSFNHSNPP